MKIKSILAIALLISGLTPISASHANLRPVVESFKFTPDDLDLNSGNTNVTFELIVSHPNGIVNTKTKVTLNGPVNSTFSTDIYRTDSPINLSLAKVTFKGSFTVPQGLAAGAYSVSAAEVENNPTDGYRYGSGLINPGKIRNLIGAETALLIRNGEDLNLDYVTFVGPTFNTNLAVSYNDPSIYNNNNPPIWKVGENYTLSKYFELRVPELSLIVTSNTPSVCSTDGKELKLLATGNCTFKVATLKTKNYSARESIQSVTVTEARLKQNLFIGSIQDQNSKGLPKIIEIIKVFSPTGAYVLPKSESPTVCIAAGFYVQIIGGGTCTLTYQSEATTNYLASDLYKVSFEVTRDPQTINFSLPTSANLSSKTVALSATASSGGSVLYTTSTPDSCSITGSTLNLLKSGNCSVTATQPGSSTIAPISVTASVMIAGTIAPSKKNITCVKGKKSKKVSGTNPKCPRGYVVKRVN